MKPKLTTPPQLSNLVTDNTQKTSNILKTNWLLDLKLGAKIPNRMGYRTMQKKNFDKFVIFRNSVVELYRSPACLHTRTWLLSVPKTNRDSSLNTIFCQSVTFHIDLAWHHCRRSGRCSGVKGSARKGRLDLRFASAKCLEIVCGTIATLTSAPIVERVTVGSSKCLPQDPSILSPHGIPGRSRPVFHAWVPSRVHCSQQFQTAHSERSTWPATRRVDQRAVFIPMIRPLSNSLNCEKCLLARLPGMFRLPKSSYNRRVIVTFMNLRICAGLYSTLFLIVAPPRRV
ncbi:uncharacterized protein TNCV_2195611 [Trichonephila clavipes]|nr:uncharacterized protein TNCV_2195611 [Trichonephila clavipes]